MLAEKRWHFGWYGDGYLTHPVNSSETALYDRSLLAVHDGVARFSVRPNTEGRTDSGRTEPQLGAVINTDPGQAHVGFSIGYGFVEARLQQPAGSAAEALWPGFWLNGYDWPANMEIDVVEGDGTDSGCSFNIHYGPVGTDVTNLNGIDRTRTVPGATSGMHVYGADIRPHGVTFYYDGRPVYTYSGPVPDAERYLVIGLSTGGTVTQERTMLVDWVRAWRRSADGSR
ncbi:MULTISPECIES: glycoside hydrolase family 16 protein [unclassified Geodermatophilus]